MPKSEFAEVISPTSIIWRPKLYSCFEQLCMKKPLASGIFRKNKSEYAERNSQTMSLRSRFKKGAHPNPSGNRDDKIDSYAAEHDEAELDVACLPGDTEEDVIVGQIGMIELPQLPELSPTKDQEEVKDTLAILPRTKTLGSHTINKRPQFSTKNPYRSIASPGLRSNMKTFWAPSIISINLSFEIGPPKVLLVEDNKIQRIEMIAKLTEACGWQPDIACNGVEAVQKYIEYSQLNYRYTAIFMDLTMPEMDGFTATRRIRSLELSNDYLMTRIIGMLGSFEKESEQRCKDSGMNFTGIC